MASEAPGLEEEFASPRHQRRCSEVSPGVALRAVSLHELLAVQMRRGLLAPTGLNRVAQHRVGPKGILAVSVGRLQAASLAVVAGCAAEFGELVPPLPAAVANHVPYRFRVGVGAERLFE